MTAHVLLDLLSNLPMDPVASSAHSALHLLVLGQLDEVSIVVNNFWFACIVLAEDQSISFNYYVSNLYDDLVTEMKSRVFWPFHCDTKLLVQFSFLNNGGLRFEQRLCAHRTAVGALHEFFLVDG